MYESFDENSENYNLAIINQQRDFIVVNPDSRPVGLWNSSFLFTLLSMQSSAFWEILWSWAYLSGYAEWTCGPSSLVKSMQFIPIEYCGKNIELTFTLIEKSYDASSLNKIADTLPSDPLQQFTISMGWINPKVNWKTVFLNAFQWWRISSISMLISLASAK